MFFLLFLMMTEGSGSVSLTNGSGCGSGRPKNMWILRNRIRKTVAVSRVGDTILLRVSSPGNWLEEVFLASYILNLCHACIDRNQDKNILWGTVTQNWLWNSSPVIFSFFLRAKNRNAPTVQYVLKRNNRLIKTAKLVEIRKQTSMVDERD